MVTENNNDDDNINYTYHKTKEYPSTLPPHFLNQNGSCYKSDEGDEFFQNPLSYHKYFDGLRKKESNNNEIYNFKQNGETKPSFSNTLTKNNLGDCRSNMSHHDTMKNINYDSTSTYDNFYKTHNSSPYNNVNNKYYNGKYNSVNGYPTQTCNYNQKKFAQTYDQSGYDNAKKMLKTTSHQLSDDTYWNPEKYRKLRGMVAPVMIKIAEKDLALKHPVKKNYYNFRNALKRGINGHSTEEHSDDQIIGNGRFEPRYLRENGRAYTLSCVNSTPTSRKSYQRDNHEQRYINEHNEYESSPEDVISPFLSPCTSAQGNANSYRNVATQYQQLRAPYLRHDGYESEWPRNWNRNQRINLQELLLAAKHGTTNDNYNYNCNHNNNNANSKRSNSFVSNTNINTANVERRNDPPYTRTGEGKLIDQKYYDASSPNHDFYNDDVQKQRSQSTLPAMHPKYLPPPISSTRPNNQDFTFKNESKCIDDNNIICSNTYHPNHYLPKNYEVQESAPKYTNGYEERSDTASHKDDTNSKLLLLNTTFDSSTMSFPSSSMSPHRSGVYEQLPFVHRYLDGGGFDYPPSTENKTTQANGTSKFNLGNNIMNATNFDTIRKIDITYDSKTLSKRKDSYENIIEDFERNLNQYSYHPNVSNNDLTYKQAPKLHEPTKFSVTHYATNNNSNCNNRHWRLIGGGLQNDPIHSLEPKITQNHSMPFSNVLQQNAQNDVVDSEGKIYAHYNECDADSIPANRPRDYSQSWQNASRALNQQHVQNDYHSTGYILGPMGKTNQLSVTNGKYGDSVKGIESTSNSVNHKNKMGQLCVEVNGKPTPKKDGTKNSNDSGFIFPHHLSELLKGSDQKVDKSNNVNELGIKTSGMYLNTTESTHQSNKIYDTFDKRTKSKSDLIGGGYVSTFTPPNTINYSYVLNNPSYDNNVYVSANNSLASNTSKNFLHENKPQLLSDDNPKTTNPIPTPPPPDLLGELKKRLQARKAFLHKYINPIVTLNNPVRKTFDNGAINVSNTYFELNTPHISSYNNKNNNNNTNSISRSLADVPKAPIKDSTLSSETTNSDTIFITKHTTQLSTATIKPIITAPTVPSLSITKTFNIDIMGEEIYSDDPLPNQKCENAGNTCKVDSKNEGLNIDRGCSNIISDVTKESNKSLENLSMEIDTEFKEKKRDCVDESTMTTTSLIMALDKSMNTSVLLENSNSISGSITGGNSTETNDKNDTSPLKQNIFKINEILPANSNGINKANITEAFMNKDCDFHKIHINTNRSQNIDFEQSSIQLLQKKLKLLNLLNETDNLVNNNANLNYLCGHDKNMEHERNKVEGVQDICQDSPLKVEINGNWVRQGPSSNYASVNSLNLSPSSFADVFRLYNNAGKLMLCQSCDTNVRNVAISMAEQSLRRITSPIRSLATASPSPSTNLSPNTHKDCSPRPQPNINDNFVDVSTNTSPQKVGSPKCNNENLIHHSTLRPTLNHSISVNRVVQPQTEPQSSEDTIKDQKEENLVNSITPSSHMKSSNNNTNNINNDISTTLSTPITNISNNVDEGFANGGEDSLSIPDTLISVDSSQSPPSSSNVTTIKQNVGQSKNQSNHSTLISSLETTTFLKKENDSEKVDVDQNQTTTCGKIESFLSKEKIDEIISNLSSRRASFRQKRSKTSTNLMSHSETSPAICSQANSNVNNSENVNNLRTNPTNVTNSNNTENTLEPNVKPSVMIRSYTNPNIQAFKQFYEEKDQHAKPLSCNDNDVGNEELTVKEPTHNKPGNNPGNKPFTPNDYVPFGKFRYSLQNYQRKIQRDTDSDTNNTNSNSDNNNKRMLTDKTYAWIKQHGKVEGDALSNHTFPSLTNVIFKSNSLKSSNIVSNTDETLKSDVENNHSTKTLTNKRKLLLPHVKQNGYTEMLIEYNPLLDDGLLLNGEQNCLNTTFDHNEPKNTNDITNSQKKDLTKNNETVTAKNQVINKYHGGNNVEEGHYDVATNRIILNPYNNIIDNESQESLNEAIKETNEPDLNTTLTLESPSSQLATNGNEFGSFVNKANRSNRNVPFQSNFMAKNNALNTHPMFLPMHPLPSSSMFEYQHRSPLYSQPIMEDPAEKLVIDSDFDKALHIMNESLIEGNACRHTQTTIDKMKILVTTHWLNLIKKSSMFLNQNKQQSKNESNQSLNQSQNENHNVETNESKQNDDTLMMTSSIQLLATNVEFHLDHCESISKHILHYVVNCKDNMGNTALHYAISSGNFDIVSILIDTKLCDINAINNAGYTPIMLTALAHYENPLCFDVAKRLYQMGDVNVKAKSNGQTALMIASSHGRDDIVRALLEYGSANPNIRDLDGSTALMCAAEHGHSQVAKLLLAHPDTDTNIVDNDNATALSIAVKAGHKDIGILIYAHQNLIQLQNQNFVPSINRKALVSSSSLSNLCSGYNSTK